MPTALQQVLVLAWRHYVVWSRSLLTSFSLHIAGPIILMYGLGVAFGWQDKLDFIVPGMMINGIASAAFISCTYGAMERFYSRRYDSWLAATLSVRQVVLAEACYQGFKGLVMATGIWLAGLILGLSFQPLTFLQSVPVLMLTGAVAGMLGYCVVAIAKTYDEITYSEPFLTGAFVFSGVFVTISAFPAPLQWFAYALPIYHGIELIRPLFTGTEMVMGKASLHLGMLIVMLIGAGWAATKLFQHKLLA